MTYVAANGQISKKPLPCSEEGSSVSFARMGNSRYLLIFGGRVPEDSPVAYERLADSSLYWFNLDTREWGKILPASGRKPPMPRLGATSLFHDSKLYIFGGKVQSRVKDSISLVHARSYCIAEIVSGPIVNGREKLQVHWSDG